MLSRIFIDRPIFASVISLIIVFAGLVALRALPLEEYPIIDPPLVSISAFYPGANAKTIASNVAAVLEQRINGTENMIYMSSKSSSSGEMNLSAYFEIGTDIDMAQINVQNRVNTAIALLPQEVQRTGVTVKKEAAGFLMIMAISSPSGRFSDVFTSNYASLNIIDELLRVDGVSEASILGARDYAMRIWMLPDRMAELEITVQDILNAVREQNSDYAIGQIGQSPTSTAVELTIPVLTEGRLTKPEEFENIAIRVKPDGTRVLLKDVARVELGAQNYDVIGKVDGHATTLIAIHQQIGKNALDVANQVKATMERVSAKFPPGLTYTIPYDTTKYIKASIAAVVRTVFEAALLVVVVVLFFLQNFRAALIPLLAMLVSIIGTFAGMYLLGFSLNTLTLFGLILSVGIVVDDAIVVVENAERNIREFGLSPRDATIKAMSEVTGPVIAIVCVLCAVFIPVAFMGGTVGQLYKQFAITIAISVVISGIVALTLSPALTALLLKPHLKESRFTTIFNRVFDKITRSYLKGVSWIATHAIIGFCLFAAICAAMAAMFAIVPKGFTPQEDQGYFIVAEKLPNGSSLGRTEKVANQILEITSHEPSVVNEVSFTGYSMFDGLLTSNAGVNFITLKDWEDRTAKDQHVNSILQRLQTKYFQIRDAIVMAFNPTGGGIGGLEFWIQNRDDTGVGGLDAAVQHFLEIARKRPELSSMYTSFESNNIQLSIQVNKDKALLLGVSIADVFQSLNALLGSVYINDFNLYGRVFKVMAQADPAYRAKIDSIDEIYVRSAQGAMVPLKSIIDVGYTRGPVVISRFNGFPAAQIIGDVTPGYSSGQAIDIIEQIAKEALPAGASIGWSGRSYQEILSGSASTKVLLAGMVVVFLILAALYEKWSLPIAIILTVPLAAFGAILAVWFRGLANDVFFQIGLVTLIALSAKNAILIVEFAMQKYAEGMPILEAAIEAAKLRFRAILMTSLTFIFGVIPLVISSGAGAASRQSVGTGVMGGMIAATLFSVFFVPLFFKVIMQLSEKKRTPKLANTIEKTPLQANRETT